MDKRAFLVERIENELTEYLNELENYDFGALTGCFEYAARMQKVCELISQGYLIKEDDVEYFSSIEKPLEAICDTYEPNEVDLIDSLEHVIWEIRDKDLCSEKIPEYIQEVVSKMAENMTYITRDDIGASETSKRIQMFNYISDAPADLTETDTKVLMQFADPVKVILDLASYEIAPQKRIDTALEKLKTSDIYSLPYQLDHENILPDSKFRHKAINDIIEIVPKADFETTMKWIVAHKNLAEVLEECETEAFNPYECFVKALNTVKAEQGDEILQQLYDMGKECTVLDTEFVEAAKYLADGGNIESVPKLANDGYFEAPYDEMKNNGISM